MASRGKENRDSNESKVELEKIPWDDEIVAWLMKCVQTNYGHTNKSTANAKYIWDKIGHEFYGHNMMGEYRGLVNLSAIGIMEAGGLRRVRDKYNQTFTTVSKNMGGAENKSKMSGDLSRTYEIVKQMALDIQAVEAKAEEADKSKAKLNALASSILSGDGPGKRKHIDGTTSGSNKTAKKTSSSTAFEETLLRIFESDNADATANTVHAEMNAWATAMDKTMDDVILEGKIIDGHEVLMQFELDVFFSMFCAESFSSEIFNKKVIQVGLSPINTYKLYALLQRWRKEAHSYAVNEVDDLPPARAVAAPPARALAAPEPAPGPAIVPALPEVYLTPVASDDDSDDDDPVNNLIDLRDF